jgi:polyisoprenoid-binding protein YceI
LKKHGAWSLLAFASRGDTRRISESVPQAKISFEIESRTARRFSLALVPLLALVWTADLAAQFPGSYRVDARSSHVEIHLFRSGFLSMMGSDHLIALTDFSGTAQLADGQPWWVRMLAEARSLKVLDPWASPSERREVADTMLGPSQLDIRDYPLIKLQSSSIVPDQHDSNWRLVANVTLHGVTRRVEFPLDCQQSADRVRVRGKKDLRMRDFNIQPLSWGLGAVKVKNKFEVTYDITLERKP